MCVKDHECGIALPLPPCCTHTEDRYKYRVQSVNHTCAFHEHTGSEPAQMHALTHTHSSLTSDVEVDPKTTHPTSAWPLPVAHACSTCLRHARPQICSPCSTAQLRGKLHQLTMTSALLEAFLSQPLEGPLSFSALGSNLAHTHAPSHRTDP